MKDIRKFWNETRHDLVEMAERTKESQKVAFDLLATYDTLTRDEKLVVNGILAEWLISDDNTLRYDACFIISQRGIKELMKDVQNAIEFSKRRDNPEGKFETKKLIRILQDLAE